MPQNHNNVIHFNAFFFLLKDLTKENNTLLYNKLSQECLVPTLKLLLSLLDTVKNRILVLYNLDQNFVYLPVPHNFFSRMFVDTHTFLSLALVKSYTISTTLESFYLL